VTILVAFDFAKVDINDVLHDDGKKYELQLDSGSFTPAKGFQTTNIIGNSTLGETENFFFLQTTHYLDFDERKNLEDDGITLVDFLNGFVYMASARSDSLNAFPVDSHPEIRSAIPIDPSVKLLSAIKNKSIPPWISDQLRRFDPTLTDHAIVTVFFHQQLPANKMIQIVTAKGGQVGLAMEGIRAVSALMSFQEISNLSKHSAVKFIRYQDPTLEPEISEAKRITNIAQVNDQTGLSENIDGLTGKNTVALIFDGAFVNKHKDFENRLFFLPGNPPNPNDPDVPHAVHVAGILGGGGIINPNNKGVAPKVQILSWGHLHHPQDDSSAGSYSLDNLWASDPGDLISAFKTANDTLETTQTAGTSSIIIGDRIDLMNISLGQRVNVLNLDCKYHGDYTTTSKILDEFVHGYHKDMKNYEKIIITKSGGNERNPNNCKDSSDNLIEFGTVNSPATAKNPIVVGSIDSDLYPNTHDPISNFSSFGPTDDGRIKPDLVAPGTHNSDDYSTEQAHGIVSTAREIAQYTTRSGTSMAAPLVGGLVSLMEEKWEQNPPAFEPHLLPHTAKAILIHTANDLGTPGPDYKYGWGMVDGKKAIDLIKNSQTVDARSTVMPVSARPIVPITSSSTIIYDSFSDSDLEKNYSLVLQVPTDLKLTLVWDDFPASPEEFSSGNLKNNLDLLLSRNDYPIKPFVLKKDDPTAIASPGYDDVNNVEMITSQSQKGTLEITVTATNPLMTVQDFTLIVSTTSDPVKPLKLQAIPDQTVDENKLLTFDVELTSSSLPGVIFSLEPQIPGAVIDPNSGKFTWTPNNSQGMSTPYNFVITVKKDGIIQDQKTVNVIVKGCMIATATYGSSLAPEVQMLREIRDNQLLTTSSGATFMAFFNTYYYTFSPTIANYERENPTFKELVKIVITPMLYSLSIMSAADSEIEIVGFGVGVILLNIGMYFVLPIFAIIRLKKYFKK
jgi:subtilisin family serine protease